MQIVCFDINLTTEIFNILTNDLDFNLMILNTSVPKINEYRFDIDLILNNMHRTNNPIFIPVNIDGKIIRIIRSAHTEDNMSLKNNNPLSEKYKSFDNLELKNILINMEDNVKIYHFWDSYILKLEPFSTKNTYKTILWKP